ncbi:glycoside hydrolase family 13 protein [Sistotremastrum suecicum HHB10207 ss-3]|uniref:Alpha-amylase n=1 Tax=Sistotremastrum suecicum HHB10207 ss-3 TaxID=1314776 RepID=A0A166B801_9AGAM|nr:glycoside hydrolase family 13 protein [Sistotremastrum suecicum HHB10207 ss-3]
MPIPSFIQTALALLSITLLSLPTTLSSPLVTRQPSKTNDVIIQMFQWSWASIAAECTSFIGPAGYGYVQVSPAQEHIQGAQWWTDYQPVSYIIESKRGTRAQYQSMIQTCHAAGVGVIADTIWNHMAGISGGVGVAGSSFTKFNYPGIYASTDFHTNCGTPDNQIDDYNNATEVWTCELDGLADLATDTDATVKSRLAVYANDLLSLGVDGFRLDASKSINYNDIKIILGRVANTQAGGRPYVTQEVIWGAGQPVTPAEYVQNGDVMEFRFASTIQTALSSSGLSGMVNSINTGGWVSSSQANIFVADHDTERSGGSLNYNSPSNTYTLAHVFMLAYPYGTPTVLSGYTFSNTDQGSPNNGSGTCYGAGGTNGWLCQHRWSAIAGLVGFRNHVGLSSAVTNYVAPSSQQVAFGRGALGFVAINNQDSTWTSSFTTSLPAGSYCDVASGSAASGGKCSGAAYTVSGGKVSFTVPARTAIALHTGQMGTTSAVAVTFDVTATTNYGENIFITGSIPALSSWSTTNAIPLSSAAYPTWSVTINIPASTSFQYKYIRIQNGAVTWEYDPNRSLTTGAAGGALVQHDSWNGPAP